MKQPWILALVAFALLPLGLISVVKDQPYTRAYSYTVPPGQYIYIGLHVTNGGRVSGDFVESQSRPVTVYIFNQDQFDKYQANQPTASLGSSAELSQGSYVVSILVPGTYYLVTAHGAGYSQVSEFVNLTLNIDGTNVPYRGLESLAPIGAILVVAGPVLQRRRTRKLISSFLQKYPNFGPGRGEDDERILNIAKDLCQKLRFDFSPVTVYWIAWLKFAGVREAPPDNPLIGMKGLRRGSVQLHAALRGRLDPGEWEPLLASSLMLTFQPELNRRGRILRRIWIATTIGIALVTFLVVSFLDSLIFTNTFFQLLTSYALFYTGAVAAFLLIMITARRTNMNVRKNFLEADRLAAGIVGKDPILRSLRKIDSMKLDDLENRRNEKNTIWGRQGVLPWPSIQQRIQNLERV